MKNKIEIMYGDISEIQADGIICQANTDLEIEDRITRRLVDKGEDTIRDACNQFANVKKGDAVITTAGKLPAQFLIHTVITSMGDEVEEEDMMLGMRNALNLAKEKSLKTITMPLIGIGELGISIKRAAELMLAEIKRHLEAETSVERLIFVLEDEAQYEACEEEFRQL